MGQVPKHRGLWELLTDRNLTEGIVVRFEIGLTYTVGEGWAREGKRIDDEEAHDLLGGMVVDDEAWTVPVIARLLVIAALIAAVLAFVFVVFTDPAQTRLAVAFAAGGLGALSVAALL